ncbi:hypothetical protein [Propionivibrio dicarboxylicus]|uniref:Phosphoribosyl transferase n=1 Tax=Propionivibrio dicarboxylicus TaxID=83767 RepID=A0A1G8GFP0_9RHOO|nr:hypothetical protein [Propionivibrio dicarboxylicus]SDH93178.1 hypothetical protein SAMN05660652_02575 [Propionivibrio dicarboxylicus]
MSDDSPGIPTLALIVPGEHGALHGSLSLLPDAPGLVVLVHAGPPEDNANGAFTDLLRQSGLSTLNADLIAATEEHYPDLHHNIPQLARRLLLFLDQIRHRMQMGEIPVQPLALHADEDTAPVIVRIASQRDHDIAALVCRGGLVDLAGVVYLRTLASPLLLLHDLGDDRRIAANRRALREVRCHAELRVIADADARKTDTANRLAAQWIRRFLPPPAQAH